MLVLLLSVTTLIYKLLIVSKNNDSTLSAATINSSDPEGTLPTPNANYADAVAVVKALGNAKPVSLELTATTTDTNVVTMGEMKRFVAGLTGRGE